MISEENLKEITDKDGEIDELELLTLQDQEAARNTFFRRPKKSPHVSAGPGYIEYKTIEDVARITKIDEVVLHILCEFTFIPIWLIQQWYRDFDLDGYRFVENWIKVGLAWCEPTALGVYIRPTRFMLDQIFMESNQGTDEEKVKEKEDLEFRKKFRGLPFNLMNHTCSEMQIMFDIMMGNEKSELWQLIKQENKLPCYHPLGITPVNDTGTIIISESWFRENRFKPDEILKGQERVRQDILDKKAFSAEFVNWELFPIVKGYDSSTKSGNKLNTQRPDLIIPIPRIEGVAQSYAIEMELTPKDAKRYDNIMQNYKDNDKFGKLFYLCGSGIIASRVKAAYKKAGGLGSCRLFIIPYDAPAQQLSNFTFKDIEDQKNMIKLTSAYTNTGEE